MVSEGEGDECGGKELGHGSKMNIEYVFMADLAFHIFQAKRMLCLAGGICIFAWSEKKVEGHPNAIDGGLITSRVSSSSELGSSEKYYHWHWFDSRWRTVFLFPSRKHSTEAKILFASFV